MVKDARAHDQIERTVQHAGAFDRQWLDLEIRQAVLLLELLRVLDARHADVDADDPGVRPAERVLGSLPRAASGDQDVEVATIRRAGPQQVILGPKSIRIPPLVARAIQILDGRRIGMTRVEIAHRIGVRLRPGANTWCLPDCVRHSWSRDATSLPRRRSTPWPPAAAWPSRAPGRC